AALPSVAAFATPAPLPPEVEALYAAEPVALAPNDAHDDRDHIQPGDATLLIVENDLGFAKVLLDAARRQGLKGLVCGSAAGALAMLAEHRPSAVTLDIFLPDMQGWRILDRLKADLATRHIPIWVLSTEDARERAFDAGGVGCIPKPLASREALDGAP